MNGLTFITSFKGGYLGGSLVHITHRYIEGDGEARGKVVDLV